MKDSPFPDWMRPDLSRVFVTLNTLKWNSTPIAIVLQMDSELDQKVLNYLKNWAKIKGLPLALISPDAGEKMTLGTELELISC
jgi:hypothetical protein